ncbi:MAG: prolipoprotein diacylglyceryl transferase [Bacillota bacterium]|jgi:phosphatidylglycerol:prolipoprotein diacylglycerol transferase
MTDPGVAFEIGNIPIRWYGILISAAVFIAGSLAYRECKRQHLNQEEAVNIALIGLPLTIICSRLYYVLMSWEYYSQHPEEIIRIWEGGLAIHGAIISAIVLVVIYDYIRKIDFWQWADLAVPFVALGQAIGRWGNFFNQEAYGYPTDLPWAMYIDGAYRHPTFLYESIVDFIIFVVLYRLLHKPHKKATIFSLYIIFYSVARFFIERLRTDSLMIGSIRAAMLVSVIGIVAGIVILYLRRKQPVVDVLAPIPPQEKTERKKNRDK